MKKKLLPLILTVLILFSSCSTNKVSEPLELAEIPPLDIQQFCGHYGLPYDEEKIQYELYYIWQLAEEASREGGRFGTPDPLLVLQLIIAGGNAPMETELAVQDFYEYYRNNEVHEFVIDNYVTSGYGINFCTLRAQDKKDEAFYQKTDELSGYVHPENRERYFSAVNAYFAFVDTKIWNEEGHDGSGWLTWAYDSANEQKDAFLKRVEQVLTHQPVTPEAAELDELAATLDELKETRDALVGDGRIHGWHSTITQNELHEADALWQAYKDAMTAFTESQCSAEASLEMTKWMYQKRIEDVQHVIELYYDSL